MHATLPDAGAEAPPQTLKAEQLVAAGNAVHEQLQLVEYRLAVLSGLLDRYGADRDRSPQPTSSYTERAVHELQSAIEALAITERRRQVIVASLATALGREEGATLAEVVDALPPSPTATALHHLRAAMRATKARVEELVARSEDALGRRIALVAEVLASSGGGEPITYGRPLPSLPRFVDGLL